MKPICYIMVGLPASGKSTRVQQMRNIDSDVFVYSTDNYIEECAKLNGWSYDEAFGEFIEPATKHMNEMLDVVIKQRQDIIWDQTNLSVKKRSKIVKRMQQAGYNVFCECVLPPEKVDDITEWNHRLHNRAGKTIPENIITNMVKTYSIPTLDEGYDEISFYDIHGVLVKQKLLENIND